MEAEAKTTIRMMTIILVIPDFDDKKRNLNISFLLTII